MMISFSRIWTVVLRSYYSYKTDFNKMVDFTFWPLIDLVIYGFMGVAFVRTDDPRYLVAFVTALLMWQIVYRTNIEISRNVLQELWDNNIVNLLASPLSMIEWLCGLMLLGLFGLCFTIPFGVLVTYLLFNYSIKAVGMLFFVYVILLAWSGWILGLFGAGLLFWRGQAIETVVWALGWLPAPFCAVYYPESVLPVWAQKIGAWLPMTYIFRAMRASILHDEILFTDLSAAIVLNTVYFSLALLFCRYMLYRSKYHGLASL